MKAKSTLLATALGIGLSSFASAETLYVTGSTAFRSSFVSSVVHLMGDSCQAKWTGAGSVTAANQSVFSGTISGVPIVVNCAWSGSVTGIQSLTNPGDIVDSFLPETGLTTLTLTNYPATPTFAPTTNTGTGLTLIAGEADVTMSDVFQTSTIFTSPSLTDTTVAVVPFKMIAGKGAPAAINNMTPLVTQLLYGAGKISQALFTGSAADNSKFVYALGRDNGSGTRLTVMAESGKGALNPVLQYSTANGTSFTLTASLGNGGSGSGSQVATQLGFTTAAATGYDIGYLGLGDAPTALGAGAKELSWNGVFYSPAAVQGGQYTLWGYEHLFVGAAATGNDQTVADAIAAELTLNPGTAGIALSTMNVQRGAEGGLIDLNN